jgi:hypothetical protein
MPRNASLALLAFAVASAAHADGTLSCRWGAGASSLVYEAVPESGAPATDVRALMQGAPLTTLGGDPLRLPSLSAARPAHETPALVCASREREPVDGVLELTFTRRVRFGVEYTLGRCRLYYRCPAAAEGAPRPPSRLLTTPRDAEAREPSSD